MSSALDTEYLCEAKYRQWNLDESEAGTVRDVDHRALSPAGTSVEMYLAGVSVRRVEDITETLWGARISSGTMSRLNQKIYRHIETWRNRAVVGNFPYVYLDGVILKRCCADEAKNVSVLVAVGVGTDGFRQILGSAEGEKEDLEGWRRFLRQLKDRGLKGVRLIIADAPCGPFEAAAEVFPRTDWQRCVVHFYENVFSYVPSERVGDVARMLKSIHAQEDRRTAEAKSNEIVTRLEAMKLKSAAELVAQRVGETLTYYSYPSSHWREIRSNRPLEEIIREIRRRTRVGGSRRALSVDSQSCKTVAYRIDRVGKAAPAHNGYAAQAGKGGQRFKSTATDSRKRVRKILDTTVPRHPAGR
jgi:putative transposase